MTELEKELARLTPGEDMILAIGVFDGVHLGHKLLISTLTEQSKSLGLKSGVLTFKEHPLKVLSPEREVPMLVSLTKRIELLKDEGVDEVFPITFCTELAESSARRVVSLLQRYLRMKCLVFGYDSALGKDREGDYETVCELGEEIGFGVIRAGCRKLDNEIVSSTAIREAMAEGNMQKVFRMLGWEEEIGISRSCV
jgi:riboflavin kinase/FMN adenylyltransferase